MDIPTIVRYEIKFQMSDGGYFIGSGERLETAIANAMYLHERYFKDKRD